MPCAEADVQHGDEQRDEGQACVVLHQIVHKHTVLRAHRGIPAQLAYSMMRVWDEGGVEKARTCRLILFTTLSSSALTLTRSSLSTMSVSSVPTRSSGMLNRWFVDNGALYVLICCSVLHVRSGPSSKGNATSQYMREGGAAAPAQTQVFRADAATLGSMVARGEPRSIADS